MSLNDTKYAANVIETNYLDGTEHFRRICNIGTNGNPELNSLETYDSPASARSSARSKSASTMASLRATWRHHTVWDNFLFPITLGLN